LALSALQIFRDLNDPPGYSLSNGLPVRHSELAQAPDDDLVLCRPNADALPELAEMRFEPDAPACDSFAADTVVLERWEGGRLVWHRDEALEFERW